MHFKARAGEGLGDGGVAGAFVDLELGVEVEGPALGVAGELEQLVGRAR
jgi:hypothetical protein